MKGQLGFEFLMIMFIVMLILVLIFTATTSNQVGLQETQKERKLKGVCERVADTINRAVYYGAGFSQTITIPETIYGSNYTLDVIGNKTLVCSNSKTDIISTFIENNITNSTSIAPFSISNKIIIISNNETRVLIE